MNPLEVLPYDGVFRVLVRSETQPSVKYLVDLDANGGIGKCGCIDFETRHGPEIRRLSLEQRWRDPDSLRCKHLKVLHASIAPKVLDDILKQRAEKARKS